MKWILSSMTIGSGVFSSLRFASGDFEGLTGSSTVSDLADVAAEDASEALWDAEAFENLEEDLDAFLSSFAFCFFAFGGGQSGFGGANCDRNATMASFLTSPSNTTYSLISTESHQMSIKSI